MENCRDEGRETLASPSSAGSCACDVSARFLMNNIGLFPQSQSNSAQYDSQHGEQEQLANCI